MTKFLDLGLALVDNHTQICLFLVSFMTLIGMTKWFKAFVYVHSLDYWEVFVNREGYIL